MRASQANRKSRPTAATIERASAYRVNWYFLLSVRQRETAGTEQEENGRSGHVIVAGGEHLCDASTRGRDGEAGGTPDVVRQRTPSQRTRSPCVYAWMPDTAKLRTSISCRTIALSYLEPRSLSPTRSTAGCRLAWPRGDMKSGSIVACSICSLMCPTARSSASKPAGAGSRPAGCSGWRVSWRSRSIGSSMKRNRKRRLPSPSPLETAPRGRRKPGVFSLYTRASPIRTRELKSVRW
jgi:hypothetical protein